MILERLGILTDEVSEKLDEALDWVRGHGLGYAELRMVDGANIASLDDPAVERVRRAVDGRGLKVSSLASPVFKCPLDPSRPVAAGDTFGDAASDVKAHKAKLQRVLAIAGRLGARLVRIFSFWRESDPGHYYGEIADHLSWAADQAWKTGITLVLENETACNGGYAQEVAAIVRKVGKPAALRALWDPGNETYGGREAFPEGYAHVRGLVAHVHLKDAVPGRAVLFGQGRTPLADQIRALERDGYRGLYTLEPRWAPEGRTAAEGSALCLEGLKRLLA